MKSTDDNNAPLTLIEDNTCISISQKTPTLCDDEDAIMFDLSQVSLSPVESVLSRLQSDIALPVINNALQLLDKSPIPRKKLKQSQWLENKLEQTNNFIRKSLKMPVEDTDSAQIISQLKEKFKSVTTTKAERYQILTLLPSNWTRGRISEEFGASLYMVTEARKLRLEQGILATPHAKLGKCRTCN